MIEDVQVVDVVALGHVALVGIASVIEAGIVLLPRHLGDASLPDFVRQQLAGGGLDDVQGAVFGAAGRGAVSDVLAIVRREPPVERHGAVGGHLVGIHQRPVFSMQAFPHQQHRLVLGALAPDIKEVRPGELRRPDGANRKQLGQPIVDAVAPRQRIEQAAGVRHLIAHISLRVRTAGILQPAVGIGNLVPMNGIDDRVHLGLGRPRGRAGAGSGIIRRPCQRGHQRKASNDPEQTGTSWHKAPHRIRRTPAPGVRVSKFKPSQF